MASTRQETSTAPVRQDEGTFDRRGTEQQYTRLAQNHADALALLEGIRSQGSLNERMIPQIDRVLNEPKSW